MDSPRGDTSAEAPAKKTRTTRAARVAAPGAQRVIFTGVLAAPDDFGRLRVLLVERRADGTPDFSWATLAREVPAGGPDYSPPYELAPVELAKGPDRDEVRGVAWVSVPARHREHWKAVAEDLRGKEVRVEATVRPFAFTGPEGRARRGAALDLAMLEARPSIWLCCPSGTGPQAPRSCVSSALMGAWGS